MHPLKGQGLGKRGQAGNRSTQHGPPHAHGQQQSRSRACVAGRGASCSWQSPAVYPLEGTTAARMSSVTNLLGWCLQHANGEDGVSLGGVPRSPRSADQRQMSSALSHELVGVVPAATGKWSQGVSLEVPPPRPATNLLRWRLHAGARARAAQLQGSGVALGEAGVVPVGRGRQGAARVGGAHESTAAAGIMEPKQQANGEETPSGTRAERIRLVKPVARA